MLPINSSSNWQKHTSKNPIQKLLIKFFYKKLFETIKPLNFNSFLDVGCGEGFTLNKIKSLYPDLKLAGLDLSKEAIALAKKDNQNIEYRVGNIYNLPYGAKKFDLVLCTEVLEHLNKPERAIEEVKRVSGHYCIFSVPNEPWFRIANFIRGKYLFTFGNHPEHINHWNKASLIKLLKKLDLKIVSIKLPFPWIIVLMKKS